MVSKVVFLGMNEAGEKICEWLNTRNDAEILEVITEKENLDTVKQLEPDLVLSSGFEYLVPYEILEVPDKGAVNLHPSYLPFNRGAHPYIWPLIDGTPAGVSIHYMDEDIDTGPIIDKKKVPVNSGDTAYSLRERLMSRMVELFKKNWPDIRDGVEGEKQNKEEGSTHYRSELDDISMLDLEQKMTLEEAINLLRALSYGEKGLGIYNKDEEFYRIRLAIEKIDGSN